MPSAQDEEFIRFAVASGHLTQEQGEEALSALRAIEELGGSASAAEMLTKRGMLNEDQVGLVRQAIGSSKAATRVPRRLAGFELLEKIGQGGMGTVFKARQTDLDRIVAVKILSPRLARSKEFVERFMREARAAGRLSHPNIVAAIDVGESEGFYYFAMEYVDGEPLSRVVAREGCLSDARAFAIAIEVARALDHAHQRGLIHRDIKPGNIMVTSDGRVRVTDFGLAKAIGAQDPSASDSERFLGTPAYVAPEQLRSEPDIDCRADIFSLGVTLFQMLTGELPFKGANSIAVAASVLSDPLPALRKLCPDLGFTAVRVVEKMTGKNRDARYATPADVIAALETAAAAPRPKPREAAGAVQARRAARRRRARWATIVTIALIIAVNAVIFIFFSSRLLRRGGRRGTSPLPSTGQLGTSTTGFSAVDPGAEAAAQRLFEALTSAMAGVVDFARRHPGAYASQIARYRAVLDRFPHEERRALPREGKQLILQAQSELKRLERQMGEAADAELKKRAARAEALLKAGKLAGALALFQGFPDEIRTGAAVAELRRLRDHYRQRAIAGFEKLDDKGKKLIAQGSFEKARKVYRAFRGCGIPEITTRVSEALLAIERELAARGAEAVRQARVAYVQVARGILDRLAARRYPEARKMADAAIVDPKLRPVREKLRGLQTLVRSASEIWARVVAALKKLEPGKTVRVGGLAGKLIRIEGDNVHLEVGKADMARSIAELRPAEALALVSGDAMASGGQFRVKFSLFLLAERDYPSARRGLEAARTKGADVSEALDLLSRLAPSPCPTCQGGKAVPCPACQGKGYSTIQRTACVVCRGRGGGRCARCRGLGRARCTSCKGTGRVGSGFPCLQCGRRGWAKCTRCGGDGYAKCKKCKGKGATTRATPCARCRGKKSITCSTCGGKGELPAPDLVSPSGRKSRKLPG